MYRAKYARRVCRQKLSITDHCNRAANTIHAALKRLPTLPTRRRTVRSLLELSLVKNHNFAAAEQQQAHPPELFRDNSPELDHVDCRFFSTHFARVVCRHRKKKVGTSRPSATLNSKRTSAPRRWGDSAATRGK